MSFLNTLLGDAGQVAPPPAPRDRSNGNGNDNGNDYKAQIESQLSRLMSNKIPMEQLSNYREKNAKIVNGLSEIVSIIDESREHFGVFKIKIDTLKEKNGLGEKTLRDADALIGKQERVGELCAEQNRQIQEYETAKRELQRELNSKLEIIGQQNGDILRLNKEIEDLNKKQRESMTDVSSANQELIKYNQSLVDKIKTIADSQNRIIQELDNDLSQQGSQVDSNINTIKEKLIGLVDSIDDENNKMGPPQVHRNGRFPRPTRPPPPPPGNELGETIVWPAGPKPYGNGKFRSRGGKKTKKHLKKGGKGKRHMKMLKTRSRK